MLTTRDGLVSKVVGRPTATLDVQRYAITKLTVSVHRIVARMHMNVGVLARREDIAFEH